MRNPSSARRAFTGQSLLGADKYSRRQRMSRGEPVPEIIVVLTAAVAAYLDRPSNEVIIREVKTEQTTALWATYGKVRLMETRAGMNLIRRGRI